ncbi:diadenylate cyclase CdaA [Persephonella sp.]|uniref:diadenylate cyclase CdaA n=1 Tax=Persephonella sp. TaxID=2060922 RepID=UPI0026302C53|nr:diadenylate cyclase CdaA [Persephonella sp.]
MFDSIQWLIGIIKSIRINDIIDILIVATIIYYLLKFIIGTRGWQILIGLFILLSIWLVAKILHLPTIEWIFDNLWSIGIFILIVVFQPEIRRGLAKLGERGLFRYSLISKKKAIDEIIRAATFLAERKIGALIVFERNIDLENYTEGCVKLNAEISLELLISIFIPQTPLHDGAVIIRDQEVVSARCFLPLTINPNIPKNIGTRHRAGIGISEETDAVALIVSEERGEISLAVDGKLFRDLDPLTLRKKLIEVLEIEKPDFIGKLKNKLFGKKKWKK